MVGSGDDFVAETDVSETERHQQRAFLQIAVQEVDG
jgi:hypothetical protein